MSDALPIIESCEGCGMCCRGRSVPPFEGVDDPQFLALPEELREPLRPLLLDKDRIDPDEAACPWLDLTTGWCTQYEHRPTPCREFERGSYYCHFFRRKWSIPTPQR